MGDVSTVTRPEIRKVGEAVTVVFSADANYIAYFGVAALSLLENSSPDRRYDLFLLGESLSQKDLVPIEDMVGKYPHATFTYLDISPYRNPEGKDFPEIKNGEHLSEATYYRLFIPEIFRDREKVIYLDSDLIVLDDIASLYDWEMGDALLGATRDYGLFHWKELREYIASDLELASPVDYFNAGVLLFNIRQFEKENMASRIREIKARYSEPLCHDQCILNKLCEGRVSFLPHSWNVKVHLFQHADNLAVCLGEQEFSRYRGEIDHPGIIHFTSQIKPWSSQSIPYASLFWRYAVESPFSGKIMLGYIRDIAENERNRDLLATNVADVIFYRRNRFLYQWYKVLSVFTVGALRRKISSRKNELKERVRRGRLFLQRYDGE